MLFCLWAFLLLLCNYSPRCNATSVVSGQFYSHGNKMLILNCMLPWGSNFPAYMKNVGWFGIIFSPRVSRMLIFLVIVVITNKKMISYMLFYPFVSVANHDHLMKGNICGLLSRCQCWEWHHFIQNCLHIWERMEHHKDVRSFGWLPHCGLPWYNFLVLKLCWCVNAKP